MDDLKLFAKSGKEIEGLLSMVKQFGDDIGVEFGWDKWVEVTLRKSKLTHTTTTELDIDTTICELDQSETYKYLGSNKRNGT